MEIRPMKQEDDRHLIGRIYEESWKFAYRDIIPKSYLEGLSVEQWVANLDRDGMYTLVAVENGEWIGTAAYCRSRFPEFDGFGDKLILCNEKDVFNGVNFWYVLSHFMGNCPFRAVL